MDGSLTQFGRCPFHEHWCKQSCTCTTQAEFDACGRRAGYAEEIRQAQQRGARKRLARVAKRIEVNRRRAFKRARKPRRAS